MAIKGKGRTKTKQVARAPRREPVPVKAPFFTRRWVQVLCAAVAGAAVVLLVLWVIHGLNQDHTKARLKADAVTRLAAGQKWRVTVVPAVAAIGTPSRTGGAPTMFAQLNAVTTSLKNKKGKKPPKNSKDVIAKAISGAKTASTTLETFDMAKTITGQGFDVLGRTLLADSQQLMVRGLRLYGESALVTNQALGTTGATRRTLARTAESIRQSADALFATGWSDYEASLIAAGITTGGPSGITVPPSP
jgi:hypothetical protein